MNGANRKELEAIVSRVASDLSVPPEAALKRISGLLGCDTRTLQRWLDEAGEEIPDERLTLLRALCHEE